MMNRTTAEYQIQWAPVPARALAISVAALVVPVVAVYLLPTTNNGSLLVWLLALVPAFLLAYYRGWRGVAVAMAAGMAVISVGQALLVYFHQSVNDWALVAYLLTVFIGVGLGIGWVSELLHRERAKAEWLAYTDPLTGLPNRRQGLFFLEKQFAAARRGHPLSVAYLDLDDLKHINDTSGHGAGDRALRALGEALAAETRESELSARLSGDEFLCILQTESPRDVHIFLQRVRERILGAGEGRPLTFSAGISMYGPGVATAGHLMELADLAMYDAKASGGEVVSAPPSRRHKPSA
ncbi:MAG: GGDEF domain-containing protein [Gemmatimonadota bacterium]|jgi:diguanylate cyclase (GGDEF)-like protein